MTGMLTGTMLIGTMLIGTMLMKIDGGEGS